MIKIGNEVVSLRAAYEECGGVLFCKGALAREPDEIDFNREYGEDGEDGRAYFAQHLLFATHGSTAVTTTDGRPVRLSGLRS